MTEAVAAVPNLLRPEQVADTNEEISRLEAAIRHPAAQDRPLMARQVRALKQTLATLSPQPYVGKELDAAVAEEARLRAQIVEGMPTAAEMRRNPAGGGTMSGAVHKHMAWERRNKAAIAKWKHLRLRLHAGSNDSDVANLEPFRPTSGSMDLSVAQITRPDIHLPPAGAAPGVVFSDEEVALLHEVDAGLAEALAVMDNAQRGLVLEFVRKVATGETVKSVKPRKQRVWTPEQRKAAGDRLKAARTAREAAAKVEPISAQTAEPAPRSISEVEAADCAMAVDAALADRAEAGL